MKPIICINEDNGHFYASRTQDQITEQEVRRLVDSYAEMSVDALFFCTNVRRALFDSQAWEPVYEGYDPELGLDQPALTGMSDEEKKLEIGNQSLQLMHNLWLLKQRGIDHHRIWLEQCRKHGIEGWLTMRMNDVHHSNNLDCFWHSSLWKERPDLWRVSHKFESWWDRAFDYAKPEVRDHHFRLIEELLDRYDMDGLELDWIRAIYHFAPGEEEQGRHILTEFVRKVKAHVDKAAEKRGHKIKLSVRIPESPETSLRLGMDAIAWIQEGLVDQIVLSQWLSVINSDAPIELWKAIVGQHPVRILSNVSTSLLPFSAAWSQQGTQNATPEILRGMAAANIYNGSDGFYLFNYCYMEGRDDDKLQQIVADMASPEKLATTPRRHIISFNEIAAPGQPEGAVLPVSFSDSRGVSKYGSTISLYPNLGIAVDGFKKASVIIGFDRHQERPASVEELTVRVNGDPCVPGSAVDLPELPANLEPTYGFAVAPQVLHQGRNAVEISSSTNQGTVNWLELYLQ